MTEGIVEYFITDGTFLCRLACRGSTRSVICNLGGVADVARRATRAGVCGIATADTVRRGDYGNVVVTLSRVKYFVAGGTLLRSGASSGSARGVTECGGKSDVAGYTRLCSGTGSRRARSVTKRRAKNSVASSTSLCIGTSSGSARGVTESNGGGVTIARLATRAGVCGVATNLTSRLGNYRNVVMPQSRVKYFVAGGALLITLTSSRCAGLVSESGG